MSKIFLTAIDTQVTLNQDLIFQFDVFRLLCSKRPPFIGLSQWLLMCCLYSWRCSALDVLEWSTLHASCLVFVSVPAAAFDQRLINISWALCSWWKPCVWAKYLDLDFWHYHSITIRQYPLKHEHEAIDTWNSLVNTGWGSWHVCYVEPSKAYTVLLSYARWVVMTLLGQRNISSKDPICLIASLVF